MDMIMQGIWVTYREYFGRTCLAPDQSFLNLPQNVFRPGKLNNMMVIRIH